MKLSRRDSLATLGVLLLTARRSRADGDPCPPERVTKLLADVARARAGVTTLTGPFTQERTIGLLAAKVRSTGTLTLVRPDRLRWELLPPDDVIYWVTPEGLAYKSPTGQGRVPAAGQKAAAALDDLRILLGGDLAALRIRYELTGTCHGEAVTLHAVPKAGVASASGGHVSFQELAFSLAPDLISPESVTIIEGPRDRTEIRFGALRANAVVSPALMVPSGG